MNSCLIIGAVAYGVLMLPLLLACELNREHMYSVGEHDGCLRVGICSLYHGQIDWESKLDVLSTGKGSNTPLPYKLLASERATSPSVPKQTHANSDAFASVDCLTGSSLVMGNETCVHTSSVKRTAGISFGALSR